MLPPLRVELQDPRQDLFQLGARYDLIHKTVFQLEHGFVDQVVPRTELKEVLTRILQLHTRGRKRR